MANKVLLSKQYAGLISKGSWRENPSLSVAHHRRYISVLVCVMLINLVSSSIAGEIYDLHIVLVAM